MGTLIEFLSSWGDQPVLISPDKICGVRPAYGERNGFVCTLIETAHPMTYEVIGSYDETKARLVKAGLNII